MSSFDTKYLDFITIEFQKIYENLKKNNKFRTMLFIIIKIL